MAPTTPSQSRTSSEGEVVDTLINAIANLRTAASSGWTPFDPRDLQVRRSDQLQRQTR